MRAFRRDFGRRQRSGDLTAWRCVSEVVNEAVSLTPEKKRVTIDSSLIGGQQKEKTILIDCYKNDKLSDRKVCAIKWKMTPKLKSVIYRWEKKLVFSLRFKKNSMSVSKSGSLDIVMIGEQELSEET